MFIYIKISAKEIKALKKFSQFLKRFNNLCVDIVSFSKHKTKKFVTILKSPHVNKTAQEQFEYRWYTQEFFINSPKPLTLLSFLKRSKTRLFSGMKFEVKKVVSTNQKKTLTLNLIDPDNIPLKEVIDCSKKNRLFLNKYLRLFDCYGEIYSNQLELYTN